MHTGTFDWWKLKVGSRLSLDTWQSSLSVNFFQVSPLPLHRKGIIVSERNIVQRNTANTNKILQRLQHFSVVFSKMTNTNHLIS